jgi:hypothetical protein
MLGRFLRAAGSTVFGMIVASGLGVVLTQLRPQLVSGLGADHRLIEWLDAANEWFVIVVFLGGLVALLAAAVVEGGVGGGI